MSSSRPSKVFLGAGVGVVSLGLALGASVAIPPASVALAASVKASTVALPGRCQPSLSGPPFQLGFVLRITGGSLAAGPVTVNGIGATACGVFTVTPGVTGCPVTGTLLVPSEGQTFAPVTAELNLVPGQPLAVPLRIVPNDITGVVGCGTSVNGLAVTVNVNVQATVSVFGVTCSIGPDPVSLTTTLGAPGTVPSPQSFSNIPGLLRGSIPLPAAIASPTCPVGVAANLDTLAGLPTTGQLTLPVVAGLDQAGGPSS